MCGIFGYAGTHEIPTLLAQMGDISAHRGPDDVGYYTHPAAQVYFGLRRLSIIDLVGGHQPLTNEDETLWLVCNGEIYNYVELRADLEAKGHHFRTHSDVEVLLHLYEDRNFHFLDDVNGMFGLALYDMTNRRLILARDRLGIKPVYYAWDGQRLAFASELKPVLQCPWISREPDWQAISAYLHLFYIPFPRTGLTQVRKLEAGTIAVLEDKQLNFQTYWELGRFLPQQPNLPSPAEATEQLRFLLKDACRLQLRSDVPVGAFLSGGIDSSAVVALTNSEATLNMDTFTVFWQHAPEKMDERAFAREVAARYNCTYREISLSFDDFDRLLPLLVWHLEEPNADGAYVPTFVISQFARQKAKVILTGAGGDELFAGYGWYQNNPFSMSQIIKRYIWSKQKELYHLRAFTFPWRYIFPHYQDNAAADFMSQCDRLSSTDRLNTDMACDLKLWLQDDILLLTDKMSMAASLEARVPLLDHRIVEFTLGLPSSYKLANGENKIIFKQAVSPYLPETILNRRKDGFGAPINSWMQRTLQNTAMDLLQRGELVKLGVLNQASLRRLDYLIRVRQNWRWALWILLNLELWFRFVCQSAPRPEGIRLSEL